MTGLLRARGYAVFGVSSSGHVHSPEIRSVMDVDIRDRLSVLRLLLESKPDEIYYLAACHQSAEGSENDPHDLLLRSFEINTLALNHFLSGILKGGLTSRLFYAASSRVFGNPDATVQNEETPFNPVCPYGISKVAGVHLCRYYRAKPGVYCSVGILYNHESPRRGAGFVSKKIVRAAAAVKKGLTSKLVLGNLDAVVDWGYAPDYAAAMWAILQCDEPDDFVIASGTLHSVRDFVGAAFEAVGLDWKEYVVQDAQVLSGVRPRSGLRGDYQKLHRATGWHPTVSFEEMVRAMVAAEIEETPVCGPE